MCLSKITQRFDPPNPAEITGWKIFESRGTKLYPWFYDAQSPIETGVWKSANYPGVPFEIELYDGSRYTPGFHFYFEESVARFIQDNCSWLVVLPVRVRNVHTVGTQDGGVVGVAQEMFVPKEEKP